MCVTWAVVSISRSSLSLAHALAIFHWPRDSSTPWTFLRNPIPGSAQSICTSYYFNYAIHPLHMPSISPFPSPTPSFLSISAAIFSLFLPFIFLYIMIPTVNACTNVVGHTHRALLLSQWLTVSFSPIINNWLPVCRASLGILLHKLSLLGTAIGV